MASISGCSNACRRVIPVSWAARLRFSARLFWYSLCLLLLNSRPYGLSSTRIRSGWRTSSQRVRRRKPSGSLWTVPMQVRLENRWVATRSPFSGLTAPVESMACDLHDPGRAHLVTRMNQVSNLTRRSRYQGQGAIPESAQRACERSISDSCKPRNRPPFSPPVPRPPTNPRYRVLETGLR